MEKINVLWAHNFAPEVCNSGKFMYILLDVMQGCGVNIELEYLGKLANIKDIIIARKKLSNKIKKFDIVHSQFGSMCGYLVSQLTGVKKIVSLRGSDWYGCSNGSFGEKFHGMMQRFLTRRSLNNYNMIITMSQKMTAEVRDYSKNIILECIPCGIDLNQFHFIDRFVARKHLMEDYNNDPMVLFLSNVGQNPVKRYSLAEKAYIEAKKEIPKLMFKVVNNVSHEYIPLLINASDVVLLTSTHEGWPNSIKESLACNVPFVSTDVSDLKQISDKEPNCFVVEDDPRLLGKAIVQSIKLGRINNLRKYAEQFDVKKIAEKLLQCYQRLLLS